MERGGREGGEAVKPSPQCSIFERWGEGQTSKGLQVLSDARFYELDRYECDEMEEMMLRLSEFSQNHHTFGVEKLDKYIRGGISVI
jgi:hypothetical protein